MFSNRIAGSAKFLRMPTDTQLLYFHMVLRADDDGVVESYPIMKILGVGSDNLKILLAKRFIIQLNEDQVVVITDWLEHNKIRADRKRDSIYKELLLKVCPDIKLVKATTRSDVKDNSKRLMDGPRSVHGQRKLSKVKLSKEKKNSSFKKKKPYFRGEEMRFSKNKWWVLPNGGGQWLDFAASEKDIEWK